MYLKLYNCILSGDIFCNCCYKYYIGQTHKCNMFKLQKRKAQIASIAWKNGCCVLF